MNLVILIGNVGQDPEVRETQNSKVANINLATYERYKDKNGEYQEKTEWHRLVVWGATAGFVEKYVSKGDKLAIRGRNVTRNYEKDGQTRYITEVVVDKLDKLNRSEAKQFEYPKDEEIEAGTKDLPF